MNRIAKFAIAAAVGVALSLGYSSGAFATTHHVKVQHSTANGHKLHKSIHPKHVKPFGPGSAPVKNHLIKTGHRFPKHIFK